MPTDPPPDILAGWRGFKPLHYTQVPDDFFDILLAPGLLTEGELRCCWYIIRHTFGWKKDSDAISLTQFTDGIIKADGTRLDYGAGVARNTAVRALLGLEQKGIITAQRSRAANKENAVTVYSLRMDEGQFHHGTTVVPPRNHGSSTGAPPVVPPGNPQETCQNTTIQEDEEFPDLAARKARIRGTDATIAQARYDERRRQGA